MPGKPICSYVRKSISRANGFTSVIGGGRAIVPDCERTTLVPLLLGLARDCGRHWICGCRIADDNHTIGTSPRTRSVTSRRPSPICLNQLCHTATHYRQPPVGAFGSLQVLSRPLMQFRSGVAGKVIRLFFYLLAPRPGASSTDLSSAPAGMLMAAVGSKGRLSLDIV